MVIVAWTTLIGDQQMRIQQEKDRKRTELAKKHGFKIARLPFWLANKHATKCTLLEKREIANILSGKPSFPEVPLLEQATTKPNPL